MVEVVIRLFPKTVSALKGVRVVPYPGAGRKLFNQSGIAPADHHVIRLDGGLE